LIKDFSTAVQIEVVTAGLGQAKGDAEAKFAYCSFVTPVGKFAVSGCLD